MSKEWSPDNLFDVLASPESRQILKLASEGPRTATDLADHMEASLPTIYRRAKALNQYDLLRIETEATDHGDQQTYTTNLRRGEIAIEDGRFLLNLALEHHFVDQFDEFWDDFETHTPSPREE